MNALNGIKEVVESAKSKFADSPLGKKAESFEKDKTKNYDAPLGKNELTAKERREIKKETGWSKDIVDNIRSKAEAQIYMDAGLKEVKIGEQSALIRNDIDWNKTDEKGRTNSERINKGLSPRDKNSNRIELHHIGQHNDSPLAELTYEEHRGEGNCKILHPNGNQKQTEIDRNGFNSVRADYWKNRADYNNQL